MFDGLKFNLIEMLVSAYHKIANLALFQFI